MNETCKQCMWEGDDFCYLMGIAAFYKCESWKYAPNYNVYKAGGAKNVRRSRMQVFFGSADAGTPVAVDDKHGSERGHHIVVPEPSVEAEAIDGKKDNP